MSPVVGLAAGGMQIPQAIRNAFPKWFDEHSSLGWKSEDLVDEAEYFLLIWSWMCFGTNTVITGSIIIRIL
jgi:hypothetical protein